MSSFQILKYVSQLTAILLLWSCNPDVEDTSDNNSNVVQPSGNATLKLNIGGTWKTYSIPAPTSVDKGDCMGSWEEYLTFGLTDRVFFWLGDGTLDDTTYHYSETNTLTQCDIPKVEVRSIGEAQEDLEDFYGVPLYIIYSAAGDGEFTVADLTDETVSVLWEGDLVILRTTLLDTAGVISAEFTATDISYEDFR